MKKMIAIIFAVFLALSNALPCFAEESVISNPTEYTSYTTDLGNGFTIETIIACSPSVYRNSARQSKSQNIYYGGRLVGTAVLNAAFYYDGSTSSAVNSAGSYSTASGWWFTGQSTWCSGATANLSATLTNGSANCPVSITLSCSPSGAVS